MIYWLNRQNSNSSPLNGNYYNIDKVTDQLHSFLLWSDSHKLNKRMPKICPRQPKGKPPEDLAQLFEQLGLDE